MQDRIYKIIVEKSYRFWMSVLWIVWCGCTIAITDLLEHKWNINFVLLEIFMVVMLVLPFYLLYKIGPDSPVDQILQAEFYDDRVVLRKDNSGRTIRYEDISEVSKIMVLNREHPDKGYYKVKIKNKGKNYVIYSTVDEYEKHLDFEQTELSKLYFEFKERGVKSC